MYGIKVSIERFMDPSQPGWVECRLIDASGAHHLFLEKVPVVSADDLDANSKYPCAGVVDCTILGARVAADGREVVSVDTEAPWGIAARNGRTRFDVFREQLVEISRG